MVKSDPNKILCGDVETILSILWSLIWHYSIALNIVENQPKNNPIDTYESKKIRYFFVYTYCDHINHEAYAYLGCCNGFK